MVDIKTLARHRQGLCFYDTGKACVPTLLLVAHCLNCGCKSVSHILPKTKHKENLAPE